MLLGEGLTEHNFFRHVFKNSFEIGFSLKKKQGSTSEHAASNIWVNRDPSCHASCNPTAVNLEKRLLSSRLVTIRSNRGIFREKIRKCFDYLKKQKIDPFVQILNTYSGIGKDLTEAREKKRIFADRSRKVIVAQTIVMIFVHLFQGDFNQFFDALIRILITSLLSTKKKLFVRSRWAHALTFNTLLFSSWKISSRVMCFSPFNE